MKKKNLSAAPLILIMLLFALAGFFAARAGIAASKDWPAVMTITLALLFVPAFFVVIGLHEAGHALAGVLVKFDFRMYVVGPFMWDKEETGWRFKWNRNVNVSGGMVICVPQGTDNLGKRFSIYAAGGPAASLLFTLLAYGLYKMLVTINADGNLTIQILGNIFGLMAFLSGLIFLVTMIPIHANGFSSDGARVLRLLRKGDTSRFEMLLLKILSTSTGGTRPRQLAMEELEEAMTLARRLDAPMGIYLHSFFHQAAFDRGDIEKAEGHLLDYIREADAIPSGIRGAVWLDAAFFYAYAKSDLSTSQTYWDKFKPSSILPKAQVLATEAALSLLKSERSLALAQTDEALRELPNMLDKGAGIALKERLDKLKGLSSALDPIHSGS